MGAGIDLIEVLAWDRGWGVSNIASVSNINPSYFGSYF